MYEMLNEHLNVTIINPSKHQAIADATIKTIRADVKKRTHMLHAVMLAETYSHRTRSRRMQISSGHISR
jgi:hypothetical protein